MGQEKFSLLMRTRNHWATLEDSLVVSSQLTVALIYDPTFVDVIFTPKNWKACPLKDLYAGVYISFVHNYENVEGPKIPFNDDWRNSTRYNKWILLCAALVSVAGIKHHDNGNSKKEEFTGAHGSLGWVSQSIMVVRHGSRNRELKTHIFKSKQET